MQFFILEQQVIWHFYNQEKTNMKNDRVVVFAY